MHIFNTYCIQCNISGVWWVHGNECDMCPPQHSPKGSQFNSNKFINKNSCSYQKVEF